MKHLVLGLVALLSIAGCTAPTKTYVAQEVSFSEPPLGVEAIASVGEDLLSQGVLITADGISVEPGTSITWAYDLTGGFYAQTGSDEAGNTFHAINRAGQGALTKAALADPVLYLRAAPDDSQLCAVTVLNLAACAPNVPFERVQQPTVSDRGFQQTLIYNGRIGNRINIAYREFSQSRARPAFSNDVEYDLNVSRTISYNGAQLEILSADNNSIRYRVLRNFTE